MFTIINNDQLIFVSHFRKSAIVLSWTKDLNVGEKIKALKVKLIIMHLPCKKKFCFRTLVMTKLIISSHFEVSTLKSISKRNILYHDCVLHAPGHASPLAPLALAHIRKCTFSCASLVPLCIVRWIMYCRFIQSCRLKNYKARDNPHGTPFKFHLMLNIGLGTINTWLIYPCYGLFFAYSITFKNMIS